MNVLLENTNKTSFQKSYVEIKVYTQKSLQEDVQSDRVWKRNDARDNEARISFEAVIYVSISLKEVNDVRIFLILHLVKLHYSKCTNI